MKNRILSAIITAALALTLTGCGEDEKSSAPANSSSDKTSSVSSSSTQQSAPVDSSSSSSTSASESSSSSTPESSSSSNSSAPSAADTGLQVILHGSKIADFVIKNGVLKENSHGNVGVCFDIGSDRYRASLNDFEGGDMQCSMWKSTVDNDTRHDIVDECPYRFDGSDLVISVDLNDLGLSFTFDDIDQYLLEYNPQPGAIIPSYSYLSASNVVVDKRGGASSGSSAESSSSEPVSSSSSSSSSSTPVSSSSSTPVSSSSSTPVSSSSSEPVKITRQIEGMYRAPDKAGTVYEIMRVVYYNGSSLFEFLDRRHGTYGLPEEMGTEIEFRTYGESNLTVTDKIALTRDGVDFIARWSDGTTVRYIKTSDELDWSF